MVRSYLSYRPPQLGWVLEQDLYGQLTRLCKTTASGAPAWLGGPSKTTASGALAPQGMVARQGGPSKLESGYARLTVDRPSMFPVFAYWKQQGLGNKARGPAVILNFT